MHTIGHSRPQTLSCGLITVQVFIEKKSAISGPVQFKPLLFKDQLYMLNKSKCPYK